jgi:hypothetical protein
MDSRRGEIDRQAGGFNRSFTPIIGGSLERFRIKRREK